MRQIGNLFQMVGAVKQKERRPDVVRTRAMCSVGDVYRWSVFAHEGDRQGDFGRLYVLKSTKSNFFIKCECYSVEIS